MLTHGQECLLWHLSIFSVADRDTCLIFLDEDRRDKPEYGLRTLTRWGYITRRKDGLYGITAEGLAYRNATCCAITCGGNREARQRLAQTSRVAALLWRNGIFSKDRIPENKNAFIPSPIWRNIRQGITSTARFNGMLFFHGYRLVVYHIGDGEMNWQLFSERSLFFQNYGKYDNRANGLILVCDDGKGSEIAQNIIRETLYRRKRLLSNKGGSFYETDKPQKYSRSPVTLHDQYNRAFLTEEQDLKFILGAIIEEEQIIQTYCDHMGGVVADRNDFWDIDLHPQRWILNPANDLFKYLYLLAHIKDSHHHSNIEWNLVIWKKYEPLFRKYEAQIGVVAI